MLAVPHIRVLQAFCGEDHAKNLDLFMEVPSPANTRGTLTRKWITDFEGFLSSHPSRKWETLKRIAEDCKHPSAMSNFRECCAEVRYPVEGL